MRKIKRHRIQFMVCLVCMVSLLCGCGKKEEVPTEAPKPDLRPDTTLSLEVGTEQVTFTVNDNQGFGFTDDILTVFPDKLSFDTITIEVIQSNGKADLVQGIYNGITDSSKSELEDGTFTTSTTCYVFRETDEGNFVVVKGPVQYKKDCAGISKVLQIAPIPVEEES